VSKSLERLDAVRSAKADLKTQTATVTFKPGKPVDFAALAQAIDKAGFKAGNMTIWAKGKVGEQGGQLFFIPTGLNEPLPVADGPQAAKLKSEVGKEIPLVAQVHFQERPPRLVVEGDAAKAEPDKGMEGMKDMGGMKGMEKK
jgi:copper chaperone CopZ